MKRRTAVSTVIMGAAILCAAPFSLQWSQKTISGIVLSIDQAQARVGHPGSAVSVAGVNRRHRRAERRCATGVTC
jgi:hypothetical protein